MSKYFLMGLARKIAIDQELRKLRISKIPVVEPLFSKEYFESLQEGLKSVQNTLSVLNEIREKRKL